MFLLRMAVELGAGGDSTRRKVDFPGVAESTIDVTPLEMYDSARAKIAANLRWLFAKAYGNGEYFNFHSLDTLVKCVSFEYLLLTICLAY